MASPPREFDTVLSKHTKATANLAAKLSRVRVGGLIRPSIDDIYGTSSLTRVPTIPPDLPLSFVFTNHNSLYALKLCIPSGVTTRADFDMLRALWYWRICPSHTFSMLERGPRYNVVLMVLVLARPDLQVLCKPGALEFIRAFVAAWLECQWRPLIFTAREAFLRIWNQGTFDLISFPQRQLKMLGRRSKHVHRRLEGEVQLQVPSEEADFVTFMQALSAEHIRDFGPALAAKWCKLQREAATGKKIEEEDEETGIDGMFQDLGIAKPSTYNLELVNWDDELVKSVLVDIDPNVEPSKPARNKDTFWMSVDNAFSILKGNYDGLPGYGKGAQDIEVDEDAMEE